MYGQGRQPSPGPGRSNLALIGGALAIFLAAAGAAALIITRPGPDDEVTPEGTPEVETGAPTASPAPPEVGGEPPTTPTSPPTPTPTLPPYEHLVQPGETGLFILQLYGYQTLDVVPAVLALNGLSSLDNIQSGQTLLIPRQTPTPGPTTDPNEPTPAAGEATEASEGALPPGELPFGATSPPGDAEAGDAEDRLQSDDGRYWVHKVQEGETIASIARTYDSSVPCILQNNTFTFSGQDPVIFVGQNINVCIVVTLTPTPSPTGDPTNSTATPTPTLSPPLLLAPVSGTSFGRGEDVTLQWVATHALTGDQHYLVIVQDVTNNRDFRATTTANAFTLPNELRPGVGGTVTLEWRIVVVDGSDEEAAMISGLGEPRQLTWGG